MSRDLLEAFTSPAPDRNPDASISDHSAATKPLSLFEAWESLGANAPPGQIENLAVPIVAIDEEWGEFEAAHDPDPPTLPSSSRYRYELEDLGPSRTVHTTQSSDNKGYNDPRGLSDIAILKQQSQTTFESQADPNLLFDADVDTDDFGDFADSGEAKNAELSASDFDLLSLQDDISIQPVTTPATAPPTITKRRVQGQQTTRAVKHCLATVPKSKSDMALVHFESGNEDAWDEFPDWDTVNVATTTTTPTMDCMPKSPQLELSHFQRGDSEDELPPVHIPPPAILLSIFPELFKKVETQLLKPVASLPQAARVKMYYKVETLSYLKWYILNIIVCARIIAGRRLRWKRDTFLAQSMRIGSAAAGRLTGMKITSVDKTELNKEEGEVAEVLRLSVSQGGRIKSAIIEAKKVYPDRLQNLPELHGSIPVKAITEIEGGVPSARPCALCGLRRDERLAKVDLNVNDSFGEWWIVRTNMHRACRDFWAEHETTLRQR